MPQFTALAHTRITVTAPDAEAAEKLIRSITDQAAEHIEASAPVADVTVHTATITALRDATTPASEDADAATLVRLIHRDADSAINGACMRQPALMRIRDRAAKILAAWS